MTTHRTTRALGALTLALALSLSAVACSSDSTSDSSSSAPASPSATQHDAADVTFATDMLPHHAQALTMVEMTAGRPLDPAVQQLAADIRSAQTPEIDTMTGWLTDWSEPVPDTSGSMSSGAMTGMMTADQMSSLDAASDADFQRSWLELMVQHHEGAVEMARTEVAEGQYQAAIDLAKSIIASQSTEIAMMKGLLG